MTRFLQQLDGVEDYLSLYRTRLATAYHKAATALSTASIPFEPASAGLFIFVDLSRWLRFFPQFGPQTPELELCEWLIQGGVFLNPGQVTSPTLRSSLNILTD